MAQKVAQNRINEEPIYDKDTPNDWIEVQVRFEADFLSPDASYEKQNPLKDKQSAK